MNPSSITPFTASSAAGRNDQHRCRGFSLSQCRTHGQISFGNVSQDKRSAVFANGLPQQSHHWHRIDSGVPPDRRARHRVAMRRNVLPGPSFWRKMRFGMGILEVNSAKKTQHVFAQSFEPLIADHHFAQADLARLAANPATVGREWRDEADTRPLPKETHPTITPVRTPLPTAVFECGVHRRHSSIGDARVLGLVQSHVISA